MSGIFEQDHMAAPVFAGYPYSLNVVKRISPTK